MVGVSRPRPSSYKVGEAKLGPKSAVGGGGGGTTLAPTASHTQATLFFPFLPGPSRPSRDIRGGVSCVALVSPSTDLSLEPRTLAGDTGKESALTGAGADAGTGTAV